MCAKVPYFFFSLKKFVGHSINQNPKLCIFFSKIRKKKIQSAKVGLGPFFFFQKLYLFFVCVFFSCKSSQCHSFNRSKICIFFFCRWKKKNTAFSFNQSIFPKNVQNMNFFREKKNTVPLLYLNFTWANFQENQRVIFDHKNRSIFERKIQKK